MREDLVSIIMPVYNGQETIADAIESVMRQVHDNWELLVVNDGSTDATLDVVQRFSDERISVVTTPNQGVSAARNVALQAMNGNFICTLDADDILPPNSLSTRLEVFARDPGISFVDGSMNRMDGTMTTVLRTQTPTFSGFPRGELIRMTGSCFAGPTWLIRVKKGYEYRFKDGMSHAEDMWFYITIADHGSYAAIKDPVLLYREGNDSAMGDLSGIASGYLLLRELIVEHYMPEHDDDLSVYEAKARSILFRSYMRKALFGKAFRSLFLWR